MDYNNNSFIVLFNANTDKEQKFDLPDGDWDVLVNSEIAGIQSLEIVKSEVRLEPSTGMLLKKK